MLLLSQLLPSPAGVFVCLLCLRLREHSHLPAPVASVLASPKDAPLEFFQDASRPLSARMSDKPGGAFSGLRPTSFVHGTRMARSRVSSITEEEQTGVQPLVSQSYSGGFGRSESSIGGGDRGGEGGDRPIASRRIAGSRSGVREGRGRSSRGDKDGRRRRSSRSRSTSRARPPPGATRKSRSGSKVSAGDGVDGSGSGGSGSKSRSTSRVEPRPPPAGATIKSRSGSKLSAGDGVDGSGSGDSGSKSRTDSGSKSHTDSGFGDDSDGDTGDEAPPQNRAQTMYKNRQQYGGSIGTALHALDRVQTISASKSHKPGAAAAAAASKATTIKKPGERRASHSGPVGGSRRASTGLNGDGVPLSTATAAQDTSTGDGGGGGGIMLPRRTSTGQLKSLITMGSNFDSVTTIGTPSANQGHSSNARAAGSRTSGVFGRSRYSMLYLCFYLCVISSLVILSSF